MDIHWMNEAACQVPGGGLNPLFYSEEAKTQAAARKICNGCPVQEDCLEYALQERIDAGMWGGVSERGRRRLLKQRRANGSATVSS